MDNFEFVQRHRVHEQPKYLFEIDEYRRSGGEQFLLAHIRVIDWSKATLVDMLKKWRVFRECVSAPLFACGEEDNAKWEAFVSLFGFKPHMEIVCNNGEKRRLFINVKDCP